MQVSLTLKLYSKISLKYVVKLFLKPSNVLAFKHCSTCSRDMKLSTLHGLNLFLIIFSQRSLNQNNLRFTHEDVFKNMSLISSLDLSNNNIDHIPDGAFDGCTALRSMYVNSNDRELFRLYMDRVGILRCTAKKAVAAYFSSKQLLHFDCAV